MIMKENNYLKDRNEVLFRELEIAKESRHAHSNLELIIADKEKDM